MQQQLAKVLAAGDDQRSALQQVDLLERRMTLTLGILATLTATATLAAGIWLARAGVLFSAQKAMVHRLHLAVFSGGLYCQFRLVQVHTMV